MTIRGIVVLKFFASWGMRLGFGFASGGMSHEPLHL